MNVFKYLPALAFAAFVGQSSAFSFSAADDAVVIAPPALDLPATSGNLQTAVFAGGCFWGVQGGIPTCARREKRRLRLRRWGGEYRAI